MLDLMDLSMRIWNGDAKYVYKNTMRNCWIKADILPLDMMEDLRNTRINNESVYANDVNHDTIYQDIDDAYNVDFSSEK